MIYSSLTTGSRRPSARSRLTGKVLDLKGQPLRNTLVEIWQVDSKGAYLHTGSANRDRRDANFQGFGRSRPDQRRIPTSAPSSPCPVSGTVPRTSTSKSSYRGQDPFTTQCYIRGEPLNAKDDVLNSIRDPKARASVLVPFMPIPESRAGELAAQFNIVLGFTPQA